MSVTHTGGRAGERTIALPARDPDIELSPRSVAQARALGRWFARELSPEPPTAILLSPYRRTRQTAAEVAIALKWRETLIVDGAGRHFLNRAGNAGLAVSGSGDLPVGILPGLLARGADPALAAAWVVYLHRRPARLPAERDPRFVIGVVRWCTLRIVRSWGVFALRTPANGGCVRCCERTTALLTEAAWRLVHSRTTLAA